MMFRLGISVVFVAQALGPAGAQETLKLPKIVFPQAQNYAPANPKPTVSPSTAREITLAAKLSEESDLIPNGIVWRIFKPDAAGDGKLPLIATASGGTTRFALEPGPYLVHAAFGRAGITKRISVGQDSREEILVLDAGGLKLNSILSGGARVPTDKLRFAIYGAEENAAGERTLILPDVKAGELIRLNAGTYQIVSNYGAENATIRADIRVEAGQLTEATVEHKAAEVTLKLVREAGGEAMADTAWSVLNPSGEIIKESVGAFASMVLAEGEYVVVAKNKDKLFQHEFVVTAGRNADVEVLTTMQTQTNPAEPQSDIIRQ